MHEQDITFVSNGFALAGTLRLPNGNGPYPAAVFVAGSGEVDRNENHRRMPLNCFNELAGHLADRGFASLRYDKRGVGASQGLFLATRYYDNVADARSAFLWLQQHEKIDPARVFVVGHSEGAIIAARMAGEGVPAAGIIMLAGAAQAGEQVLQRQATEVVRHMKGFQGWLIRALRVDPLKTQRRMLTRIKSSAKDWFRVQLIAKINAKWMREFVAYDPASDLVGVRCPVLAITGEYDIQVDPADIGRMREIVTAPFEGHIVPGVSHLLRAGQPGLADYKLQVKSRLDGRVVGLMLEWLERRNREAPVSRRIGDGQDTPG